MSQKQLIGFRNGVYDLKENLFRPNVVETLLQMPIDYMEFSENDQAVLDVHDFFTKIFPNTDNRNYFLDISSEMFEGGNKNNHVYFWKGEGNNGKSMMQMFFEKMFGPYAVRLPTSLITGKSVLSESELACTANGVRCAVIQELDKENVMDTNMLKKLTGNDTLFVPPGLFEKNHREIEPMFKLVIICNNMPLISDSDKGVWKRICVIPFESTFTENAPETWEEQMEQKCFPKDSRFAEKIPSMIQAFAWVLLNHRKKKSTS
jgi:P4 family phage/plasmid primase-like protien